MIQSVINCFTLKNKVSYLCKLAGVSRSGYHNHFKEQSQIRRAQREGRDIRVKEMVLKAFNFRNRKKGSRQIQMTLAGQFDTVYNLKRIQGIMKKYAIVCPIRKANPYRRMAKATKEHSVLPNLLNRNSSRTHQEKYY